MKHVDTIIIFVFSLLLIAAPVFCQEKKETENASDNISENFVAKENGLTHRVLFGGKDGFKAKRFDDVYNSFNEARKNIQVKWMFSKMDKDEKGNQIFMTLTDDPETVQKIIESSPQFVYIKTERLTKDMYEKHIAPWFAETRIKPRSIKDMLKSIVKESYRVDKKIIDFPEKIDLSTPENAYASQKQLAISNRKDKIEQLIKMDYQRREIPEQERRELEQEMSEDWAKTFKTEYIVYEVLKFSDEFAFIFALRQFDDLYDGNMFQKKDDGLWYNLRNFQRDVPDEMVEDVKRTVAHLKLSPQRSVTSVKDMLKSIVKESYRVDKKIIDFPEKIDLSTPENAYASQKQLAISNRKDKIEQLIKMDYQRREIPEQERRELEQEMSEDWAKTFKTEYIVYEVLKFSDELAFVFALRQFDDLYDGNMFQKKDDGLWYNLRNFQRDIPDEMVEDVKRTVAHLNLSPQSSKLKERFDVHIAEIQETDWFKLLDSKQKKYVLWDWNEWQFQYVYNPKNYEVGDERDVLEKRWIEQLEKPEPEPEESEEPESEYQESVTLSPYDKAIFGLAIIKSDRAAKLLLKISTEKVVKDNAHRYYATKALGILGDLSVIPELIPLIYHYNFNIRWDTQISLVRLTGQNFGTDVEAWGKWYNENREKLASKTNKELPVFDFTPIDWTFGSEDSKLKTFSNPEVQKKDDDLFFKRQPNN